MSTALISSATCIWCLLTGTATETPTAAWQSQGSFASLIAQAKTGNGSLNNDEYSFTYYKYTGDCPGSWYGSWENVSFRSQTTPPGEFQRVKITNTSTGGYTNREYDERRGRSEPFEMRWLGRHSNKYLAVQTGSNDFEYEISHRHQGVIETGSFRINVNSKTKTEERDFKAMQRLEYCDGEREFLSGKTDIMKCKDGFYYDEKVGVCPDGSKQKVSRRKVFTY